MRRSAIVIVGLILVTPGQAHAAVEWPSVSICTQVESLGGYVEPWSPSEGDYTILGAVGACPGAEDPQARWTVARYQTGTPGVRARLRGGKEPHGCRTCEFRSGR